jgi:hypothetical protein
MTEAKASKFWRKWHEACDEAQAKADETGRAWAGCLNRQTWAITVEEVGDEREFRATHDTFIIREPREVPTW